MSNERPLRYRALALQVPAQSVNGLSVDVARAQRLRATHEIGQSIAASKAFVGPNLKLVVLPEYVLTGFPMGESIEGWQKKGCIDMDGPELDRLGHIAQSNQIYLAMNAYELDPNFPTYISKHRSSSTPQVRWPSDTVV